MQNPIVAAHVALPAIVPARDNWREPARLDDSTPTPDFPNDTRAGDIAASLPPGELREMTFQDCRCTVWRAN